MQKEDVKPGCYRLTCDLPAISSDRRAKYDWRKAPMTAGTIFAVRECSYDGETTFLELAPLGDYSSVNVRSRSNVADAIIANMEPIAEDPSMFLTREWPTCPQSEAMGMLIKLFERGTITMADIVAMNEEEKAKTRADIADVST